MNAGKRFQFDEIGYWSEIKLDIIKEYAAAYSRILDAQEKPSFYHVYIDGFSGAGVHVSKMSGEFVPGSPLNALNIDPPFKEYHLVDLSPEKIDYLKKKVGSRSDVKIYHGDCNEILLKQVLPQVKYENYRRGLCLLDPYGLHLSWQVILTAGQMRSIELFLNFPVADMNRNVLWKESEGVDPADIARMNTYWGDHSWRQVAYSTNKNLFGWEEKEDNETIAKAFQERLRKVAGFGCVPDPIPMRNSKGATIYYLYFASHKPVANSIVNDIFSKYKERGK